MCRNAVLSGVVHFLRSYLYFKWYAFPADNGRMKRLVAVGLGHCYIVLETIRDRTEHIVNDTEYVIALDNCLKNNPHGIYIIYLRKILSLDINLLVNTVYAFYSALDYRRWLNVRYTLSYHTFYLVDKRITFILMDIKKRLYLLEAVRIKIAQSKVFHFFLYVTDTEPVSYRCVEVHRFKRSLELLFGRSARKRSHIMKSVGEL